VKIYKDNNVYEESLKRLNFIYDEFENVVCNFSGGKDSTILLHLCLKVARERNRLPLNVLFIDQEAEWQHTIDYVASVMTSKDIKPYWFQMPISMTNNTSSYERYVKCWDESNKENWVHEKHPISIKENTYGTERFHELFGAIVRKEFGHLKTAQLRGVRTEESPARLLGLTSELTYKHITWGRKYKGVDIYVLDPIYDWMFTDVWKCILDNNLSYNKIYDEFYQKGVEQNRMRVSSLHHETSIKTLLSTQEIEPKTWERIAHKVKGTNSIKHGKESSFTCPKDLPFMFNDWQEYGEHIIENIVQDEKQKQRLYKKIKTKRKIYTRHQIKIDFWKAIINTVLLADWDFVKYGNWETSYPVQTYKAFKKKNYKRVMLTSTKYLTEDEKEILLQKVKEYDKDRKNTTKGVSK
jgi:predicted phosphoadenosine phosphosulfate sulfurtransferase